MQVWYPIKDLPENWQAMAYDEIQALADVWREQQDRLKESRAYKTFNERLRREIAIETGVIERLYTIDRGTTKLLIERGIDEALIGHGSTDEPPTKVVRLIRDHESAIDRVFDFVGSQRPLSTSFIKQLHQLLTKNQTHTEAIDQFGNLNSVELRSGEWKIQPNNPTRDGETFYYCPPEQVASQMDELVKLHLQHDTKNIPPDVEAAWLHHRFTQIHPFQDGNGRVARMLASLVFIRAGWFPLVITRDERDIYIDSLEQADAGNLAPLVELFAKAQKQTFLKSVSLSEEILSAGQTVDAILDSVVNQIVKQRQTELADARQTISRYANKLHDMTYSSLKDVEKQIEDALHNIIDNPQIYVKQGEADHDHADYYRYQIIETARDLDYFAYLKGYKSWAGLAIELEPSLRTEVILSFHELGYEPKGVMVVSAFGNRIIQSPEDNASNIEDIESLSEAPFEFTYLEDEDKIQRRFEKWLNEVISVGLEYWRRGL